MLAQGDRRRQSILPFILNFTFYTLHFKVIERGGGASRMRRAKTAVPTKSGQKGRREDGRAARRQENFKTIKKGTGFKIIK